MTTPSLKHGPEIPEGIVATGVLIHEVRTTRSDAGFESKDEGGQFAAGKGLRVETEHEISGDCLAAVSLPEAGTGNKVAGSPRITKVETRDLNEDASKFSISAKEDAAGSGDYGPGA